MLKPALPSAAAALIALACTAADAHAQLVGVNTGWGTPGNSSIFEVNPANANLTNLRALRLNGAGIGYVHSMAVRPGTRTLYAVIQMQTPSSTPLLLATLDHQTGAATLIGQLTTRTFRIAFGGAGGQTLYGVTMTSQLQPETLCTIHTETAVVTPAFSVGNAGLGEALAWHPSGLLYRHTGWGFQTIDPATQTVTPIVASGQASAISMAWHPELNQMLAAYEDDMNLYRINLATGARTQIGDMFDQLGYHWVYGLAFLPPAPPSCGPADLGSAGGAAGPDGLLDNSDFIAFIDRFFASHAAADLGVAGGAHGSDGLFDNNDFIAFIDHFFGGC